jgi:UDP-N-acetylmuramoyl-tripeptide--D-alanyl-D-alanine ligase
MFTVGRAAELAGGSVAHGDPGREIGDAARVTIDSRAVERGDLFVALAGTRTDGHAFVADAADRGAAAVLVSDDSVIDALPDGCAAVRVADTQDGLTSLGAGYRRGFDIPVAAVTGSCGKTTTKEMAAAILADRLETLVTPGNWNNHIGLPLTLLMLRPAHRAAVVELGVNHPGEMDHLARLCAPTHALVTNVGPAHLEGLGSAEGVAAEKGRLFAALGKDGTAIVNLDDPRVTEVAGVHTGPRLTYSARGRKADVTVAAAGDGVRVTLKGEAREASLFSTAPHQLENAAAAAALACALGIGADGVAAGLASFSPRPMRGRELAAPSGARVIDDTYNANPLSVRAAVEALMALPGPGRRVAVIGDMLELGGKAADLHRETGRMISSLGPDRLVCVGRMAAHLAEGARGLADVRTVPDPLAAAAHLEDLGAGDVVLVKGSRGLAMERLVALLTDGVGALP